MRIKSWLTLAALAAAAPAACTFGADDFNIVASTSGGDTVSNGGDSHSAGKASGGKGGTAGTDSSGNAGGMDVSNSGAGAGAETSGAGAGAGAGGDSGGVLLTCANRGPKVSLFAETDVAGQPFDKFAIVTGGSTQAYAVATTDAQMGNSLVVVRRVTDSMNNPLAEMLSFTAQGRFAFGGAYSGQQALNVVGADQRGVVVVSFATTPNGQLIMQAPTLSMLETPAACQNGQGSVRDIFAAFDGDLSYAITCQVGNDTGFTLFWRRPSGILEQITGMGDQLSYIVRQYVHSKDGTALIATGDEFGPALDLRYGKTAADLSVIHPFKAEDSADPTLFQSALLLPLADDSGIFMLDATIHDPSQGAVTPATLYAGSFKVADYASFSKVPPPQLKQMVRYTKASDIVLPAHGAARANDALLVADDPLTNSSIYASMVDLAGNTLSQRLTVYEKGASVDSPRGVQVGAGFMVMWREMGDTTTLWGRPIGCF